MDNLRKECCAELAEIPNTALLNSNKTAKTSDRAVDSSPGTSSRVCNYQLTDVKTFAEDDRADSTSLYSVESFVCRICHNNENPERLISPCLCKGSLTYVHSYCLERWISMSRCTTCELCQFQYNTEQTLRYSFCQSLRMWYSRSMSRRALQEDCQMFLLLTLIAFGIVGTLLVAVQYYILQSRISGLGRVWTRGWLMFFLLTTLIVYLINVYMIAKAQFLPWYRWWQTARDIRLIIENHSPTYASLKGIKSGKDLNSSTEALEEPRSENGDEICCREQDFPDTKQNNDATQHNIYHEVDAACQSIINPLKIFYSKNYNKCNNQLKLLKEKTKVKLQIRVFSTSNTEGTEPPNVPLEHKFDSLILTI